MSNPFMDDLPDNQWHEDTVANTRVLNSLRRKIQRIEFYTNHPVHNEPWDNEILNNLNIELRHYKDLLNKARYN